MVSTARLILKASFLVLAIIPFFIFLVLNMGLI